MFTKEIYKTLLKRKASVINNRLKSIIFSPSTPETIHTALDEATIEGRRFRPLLMFLTSSGTGGNWKEIVDLACAIELLHKASLVHDDLVDKDVYRRGVPSIWKKYGERQAVIIGDLLVALSFETVSQWTLTTSHKNAVKIINIFSDALKDTASGELLDLQFEDVSEIDSNLIEKMTLFKSGALIAASMRIGAVASEAPDSICETVSELGWHIGLIFQLINDINNISGIDSRTKGDWGQDYDLKKKNIATYAFQNAGVCETDIRILSKKQKAKYLEPVHLKLDHYISTAFSYIEKLPNGMMKKTFFSLLKEAKSEWFWIDNNKPANK